MMQLNKSKLVKKLDYAIKYLRESKNIMALKILNKMVKEDPSNDEAWLYLGIAKRRLGELDGAIECFKTASERNFLMLEAWGLLTITLLDQGNLEMAKKSLEKAWKLNPNNAKIEFFHNNLIRLYTKFGPFF